MRQEEDKKEEDKQTYAEEKERIFMKDRRKEEVKKITKTIVLCKERNKR